MERPKYQLNIALGILVAFHFFGFLGLHSSWMQAQLQQLTPFSSFADLTPLNLIITTSILLYFHGHWSKGFYLFAGFAFCAGFLVEVLGVATGLIFGEYSYGSALGPGFWDVPLLIGANWLVLIYCTGHISAQWVKHPVMRVLLAAGLMVLLDFFIEPVAMAFDFWDWKNNQVPLLNYIAWFFISVVLLTVFFSVRFLKYNPIAKYIFIAQFFFFLANFLMLI